MACRYYDDKNKVCKKSTQFVQVGRDRVTQYCKGNYERCPDLYSNKTSMSWDEQAKNRKAQERAGNIRMLAPLAFIAVLLLCLFKAQMGLLPSIGGGAFAAIVVLMFTNKYH